MDPTKYNRKKMKASNTGGRGGGQRVESGKRQKKHWTQSVPLGGGGGQRRDSSVTTEGEEMKGRRTAAQLNIGHVSAVCAAAAEQKKTPLRHGTTLTSITAGSICCSKALAIFSDQCIMMKILNERSSSFIRLA